MFGPETMVNIDEIRFYKQQMFTFEGSKNRIDQLTCMFVCLYVWRFGEEPQLGPNATKYDQIQQNTTKYIKIRRTTTKYIQIRPNPAISSHI